MANIYVAGRSQILSHEQHESEGDGDSPSQRTLMSDQNRLDFRKTLSSCSPEHVQDVYSPPPQGWVKSTGAEAALLTAAHANKTAEVKRLVLLCAAGEVDLEYEGCVTFPGEKPVEGATALWTAATSGHLEVVQILLDAGARINHTTASNSTPLRGASFDGNIDVVRCLLKHGADVNIANRMNQTPLSIASGKGHHDVVVLLLDHGADVNICSVSGDTALHSASEAGYENIVRLLIAAGAKHLRSREGWSPLVLAAAAGQKEIVDIIIGLAGTEYSVSERADAWDLLGATLLDLHQPKEMALDFWKSAFELRRASDCPKQNLVPPMEVYGEYTEAVEERDFAAMAMDDEYLYTNCLLVRERVLTKEHPQTPYYVRIHGDYFLAIREWERAQLCWLHALVMDQFNEIDSLDLSIVSTIAENVLICTKGLQHIEEETGGQVNFLPYFNWCLNSLRTAMKSGAVLDQLLVAALQMLGWWMSRLPDFSASDTSSLSRRSPSVTDCCQGVCQAELPYSKWWWSSSPCCQSTLGCCPSESCTLHSQASIRVGGQAASLCRRSARRVRFFWQHSIAYCRCRADGWRGRQRLYASYCTASAKSQCTQWCV